MSQSQKTLVPNLSNYSRMYLKDAPMWTVKISPVDKILLIALGQNPQPCEVPVNIYLFFHLFYLFALKSFKFTYMEMKIFENTFLPYEDLQILCMFFTSHITPHTTLGNEQCLKLLLGVSNTKERGNLSLSMV
jgi:hypothetical protein